MWIWSSDLIFEGKILVKLRMNKIYFLITYYDFFNPKCKNITLKCLNMMDIYKI